MQANVGRTALAPRAYRSLVSASAPLRPFVLLLLRLSWGWQLAESGYGHLTHVQKTVEAFQGWGVPLPDLNVYVSGVTEMVGGSLLLLGLATRLIAVPLVFNFVVAIVAASRGDIANAFHNGLLSGWDQIVNDTAFPMLMLSLVMLAFGPGAISIDCALRRFVFRPNRDAKPDEILQGTA